MSSHLTQEAIDRFNEKGYLFPVSAFSAEEANDFRRQLESLDGRFGKENARRHATEIHLVAKWAWDVIHDPRVVEPVADLLGPNVLLWSFNWFIKEPRDGKFVSYHQDATYWGLEPHDVVTAWVALSDASDATGPMKFVPGSHKQEVYEHDDTFGGDNLLSRGQVIQTEVDEDSAVLAPLSIGQMSLHHVRLIHGSTPNETDDRRIGMVLRYCATHVTQTKLRDTAVLVHGEDEYGNFDLLPEPKKDFGEEELLRQKDALRRAHRALHSKDYEN